MPDSKRIAAWLPILLGLIGLAMVLAATAPHGAGVTSDSASYFAVADHLVEGRGFTRYDGAVYSSWPPLFPILLAGGKLLGLDPPVTARWLNAIIFALIVLVTSRWGLRNLKSPFLRIAAPLLFLFAYPVLRVSLRAWTEPLFVLMGTLFLIQLSVGSRDRGRWAFAWLVATAALAWLDRYVGVTLVGTGVLVLLFEKSDGLGRRAARAALFGFLSTLLPLVWILRNWVLTGAPAGERSPSAFGFIFNLRYAFKQAGWWFVPERLGGMISIAVLLALVLLFVWIALRWRHELTGPRRDLRVFGLFTFIYLIFLLYTSNRYAFEAIHSRYLIPIYTPLFFMLFVILDPLIVQGRKSLGARSVSLLLGLWLLYPAAQSAVVIKQARAEGLLNYSRPAWRSSDLALKIAESPPEGRLFSNQPEALYYLSGVESGRSPRKTFHPTSLTQTGELETFGEPFEGGEPVILIWFDAVDPHPQRRNFHSLEEIAGRYRLDELRRCEDGSVWRVLPAADSP